MKLLFLDTETTGVEPDKHGVVQIAGIVEINGEVKEEFNFLCKPFAHQTYSPKAFEMNGRTWEEVQGFADPREVYGKLTGVLSKYVDRYSKNSASRFKIAGQNIQFDYGMMEAWFKNCGDNYWYSFVDRRGVDLMICTSMLSAAGRMPIPDFKLATICRHLGVQFEGSGAHDALSDIRATRKVWNTYLEMLRSNSPKEGVTA